MRLILVCRNVKRLAVPALLLAAWAAPAWSVTYYDAMYVPAGGSGEASDTVRVSAAVETPDVAEPSAATDTAGGAFRETLVAATLPMKVSREVYVGEDGLSVRQTYHVVVGSYSSKVNAMRMAEGLRAAGSRPSVAMSGKGLYRVFLFSGDDEADIRQRLARCRSAYPDAWILKIKNESSK